MHTSERYYSLCKNYQHIDCYSNGSDSPHCCGVMPLLHATDCVWWKRRLDASAVQGMPYCQVAVV